VESQTCLISATAERLRQGQGLSPSHESCAHRAGGILARLYVGDFKTYRSGSCRAHINQNGILDDLDLVRDRYNLPKVTRVIDA
jgi:hypothetical protein